MCVSVCQQITEGMRDITSIQARQSHAVDIIVNHCIFREIHQEHLPLTGKKYIKFTTARIRASQ